VVGTGGYLAVIIAGSYAGCPCGAYLSDRIGHKLSFIAFSLASMIIALTYTRVPMSNRLLLALGFPRGFANRESSPAWVNS
jgi:MFS family permease